MHQSFSDPSLRALFWSVVTRLGDAEILLPAFLGGVTWLALAHPAWARGRLAATGHGQAHPARATAWRWLAAVGASSAVTVGSKIAFLGFGIGSAAIDFTGFSGHAMYAMAVLPVLGALVLGRGGAAAGVLLALVVAVSRVQVQAHSWSEALSGLALGGAVAAWTLALYFSRPGAVHAPWWLPVVLAGWLTVLPWRAPPSRTQELVVAVSLKLSGRSQPYTRYQLLHGAIGRIASLR